MKPNATIKNLNEREAKGLADRIIIWAVINAELQKNTNNNGKKFIIEYIYRLLSINKILRRFMSILEKYNSAFMNKDEAAMNDVLHEDYKFTMHASGNVLSKQDVIKWALSDDINRDKVRIVYENDEIGVEHAFVTFSDGNTQAVMAVFMFKDGQIISLETGATNMPK